jgi:hypothetical protein
MDINILFDYMYLHDASLCILFEMIRMVQLYVLVTHISKHSLPTDEKEIKRFCWIILGEVFLGGKAISSVCFL